MHCFIYTYFRVIQIFNPILTGVGVGGGEAFDASQELNPYYSQGITFTVLLLRGFSSNLPGNNLVLSDFGSQLTCCHGNRILEPC